MATVAKTRDSQELESLEKALGHAFQDRKLLKLALTHPSVAHEQASRPEHNQRLEFLGDAVLQLLVTHELFGKFPKVNEGPLTKARAKLVNRRSLAEKGKQLGLGPHLILSRGEEGLGGRERPSALADAFEAVVGAVYLDGGFTAAERFVQQHFRESFGEINVIPVLENPKGELQELLQTGSAPAPQYQMLSTGGPDHDRWFECVVTHEGKELARGRGKSKKEAESAAALGALSEVKKAKTESNQGG